MVGRRTLNPSVEVRILPGQQEELIKTIVADKIKL